jgi:SAM-dependent methyltransferase
LHSSTGAAIDPTAGSPDRFGYSWHIYGDILPEHEEQFRRWTAPLQPSDWQGARVLDAGCGIGRNSYWPLRYGARSAVLIDVDHRSLEHARRNLAAFPQAEVQFHSIYDPIAPGTFDIAFSIGVIHHLAQPELAVQRLRDAVKPGGQVLVWLYGRENMGWIVRLLNPLRIHLLSRLPLAFVHFLSLPLTVILWLLLKIGCGRVAYYQLLRQLQFRHLRAIVFDHLIPRIALYYTKADAVELLRQAGLVDVRAHWVNEMSWTVIGRRPPAEKRDDPA